MITGKEFDSEDICFEEADLDLDWSGSDDPIAWLIDDDPNESNKAKRERLDLICRNVINGVIDVNSLIGTDMMAVMLRMREMADELVPKVLRAEQVGSEQEM